MNAFLDQGTSLVVMRPCEVRWNLLNIMVIELGRMSLLELHVVSLRGDVDGVHLRVVRLGT